MRSNRNTGFRKAVTTVLAASAVLLGVLLLFGKRIAGVSMVILYIPVFAWLAAAAFSFLLFSFLPDFQSDRRWYLIPGILTVVFLIGSAILWTVAPVSAGGAV